jgi:hypothetical protein
MKAIVGARCMAKGRDSCDACSKYRRLAVIELTQGAVVVGILALCSGCARAAWDAAITKRRGR